MQNKLRQRAILGHLVFLLAFVLIYQTVGCQTVNPLAPRKAVDIAAQTIVDARKANALDAQEYIEAWQLVKAAYVDVGHYEDAVLAGKKPSLDFFQSETYQRLVDWKNRALAKMATTRPA